MDRPRAPCDLPGDPGAVEERRYLLSTLEDVDFNKTEAARRLEVDVKTVRNKLKQ